MRIAGLVFLASLALVSCGKKDPAGACANDKDCGNGYSCINAVCMQVCDDSSECALGTACVDNLCQATQGAVIYKVKGTGSSQCAEAVDGTCFTDELQVEGLNLKNASFTLKGSEGNYTLDVRSATNTLATLALPTVETFAAGSYTLTATNAAGNDNTSVNILQGEPGPDATGDELVTRINDGDANGGRILESRLPTPGDIIDYLNTYTGTVNLDADLLPVSGGGVPSGDEIIQAINADGVSGKISSTRIDGGGGGGATILKVDTTADGTAIAMTRDELLALCGAPGDTDTRDDDGCDVRLGYTYYDVDGASAGTANPAIMWGNSCRLSIASDGSWSVPAECSQTQVVWDGRRVCAAGSNVGQGCTSNAQCPSSTCTVDTYVYVCNGGANDGDVCGFTGAAGGIDCGGNGAWCGPVTRFFSKYSTATTGKDNDGNVGSVLRYYAYDKFACSFADYKTGTGTDAAAGDASGADNDSNFYFWLHAPNDGDGDPRNRTTPYFNSGSRSCVLLIED